MEEVYFFFLSAAFGGVCFQCSPVIYHKIVGKPSEQRFLVSSVRIDYISIFITMCAFYVMFCAIAYNESRCLHILKMLEKVKEGMCPSSYCFELAVMADNPVFLKRFSFNI